MTDKETQAEIDRITARIAQLEHLQGINYEALKQLKLRKRKLMADLRELKTVIKATETDISATDAEVARLKNIAPGKGKRRRWLK